MSKDIARAFLAEATKRRNDPVSRNFYWTLLGWAANARRRASVRIIPAQGVLFQPTAGESR